ncbi:MAG: hypothetical protein HY744_19115 [Deltaproteobacteria bacterium]|nr:hypothetical protein [Deltaproteobacteria bacterium]
MKLDRNAIGAVVRAVADRLEGEWLLVGGAFVALCYRPERETEDMDIFALDGAGAARLELLQLAADLGLPVESLNSAADFFVQRIAGWRSQTEPLTSGARGRVLRPPPPLFLLTKLARLSEQALAATEDGALAARRAELRQALAGLR